jgi:curved DNA-binding protein CbpA
MSENTIYYRVLGITQSASLQEIRKAYHNKVRQFHPDLQENHGSEENHLRMVQINQAYCKLTKGLKAADGFGFSSDSKDGREDNNKGSAEGLEEVDPNALVPHKDPAYSYYKRGYRLFTKIHPSSWFWSNGLRDSSHFPHKIDIDAMASSIERIIDLIPWAYYYFNIVVEEYPHSHWYVDSKYKIRKIERLAPIYMKILYSYKNKRRRTPAR